MSFREDLRMLGNLVAGELDEEEPGFACEAGRRLVAEQPAALLELVDLVAAEGRKKQPREELLTGWLYLFAEGLTLLRYAVDQRSDPAIELVDRVRGKLLRLGAAKKTPSELLMLMVRAFAAARLDPGAELREMMGSLSGHLAAQAGEEADPANLGAAVEALIEQVGDDAFAIHDQIREIVDVLPSDHRQAMGEGLLHAGPRAAREAAIGWLLDAAPEVRQAIAAALEEAPPGLVSGTMLRRAIAIRNWLPEAERPALDRAIRACRRKGVNCASWAKPKLRGLWASGIDGAGAQTLFLHVEEGRRHAVASVLFKQGAGVDDAWTKQDMRRPEVTEFLGEIEEGLETFPIQRGDAITHIAHFLATNVAVGRMPPFRLLEVLETAGLGELQPAALPLDRLIETVAADLGGGALSPAAVAESLARSRNLPQEFEFLETWIEDDPQIERLLPGGRRQQRKRAALVCEVVLPRHAPKWAERMAWVAFVLRRQPDLGAARAFLVSAAQIAAGRPLDEIPLMAQLAARTARLLEI
jgi:hypothetical protein